MYNYKTNVFMITSNENTWNLCMSRVEKKLSLKNTHLAYFPFHVQLLTILIKYDIQYNCAWRNVSEIGNDCVQTAFDLLSPMIVWFVHQ